MGNEPIAEEILIEEQDAAAEEPMPEPVLPGVYPYCELSDSAVVRGGSDGWRFSTPGMSWLNVKYEATHPFRDIRNRLGVAFLNMFEPVIIGIDKRLVPAVVVSEGYAEVGYSQKLRLLLPGDRCDGPIIPGDEVYSELGEILSVIGDAKVDCRRIAMKQAPGVFKLRVNGKRFKENAIAIMVGEASRDEELLDLFNKEGVECFIARRSVDEDFEVRSDYNAFVIEINPDLSLYGYGDQEDVLLDEEEPAENADMESPIPKRKASRKKRKGRKQ